MTTTRYSIVPTLKSVTPVTGLQTYIGSVSVAVDLAGRNCYAKFYWYDSNYHFLSTSALVNPVVSTGAFGWQRLTVIAQAPSGAAYAGVVPEIQDPTGGSSCEFYVDQHKITTTLLGLPGPQPWQPPRQINIALTPNSMNEMQNPAFGEATNPLWGWRPVGPTSSIALNTSTSLHDAQSMDTTVTGFLAGDLTGVLAQGAHTLSNMALYPGSDTAKPPITTLLPDTDYTISLWVLPRSGYLPLRISFFDGVGEYVGSATPYSVYGASPPGWQRLSVTMRTGISNTGSGRITVGYFASDILPLAAAVDPTSPGQTSWVPWVNSPAGYRGMWQSTKAYAVGDVVSRGTYFATALVATTGTDPNADTGQTTWKRFTLTQASGDPLYVLGTWSNATTYPGEQLGLAVEYPAGSGITWIMAKPSLVFGATGTAPMEIHRFLTDAVLVEKGTVLNDFYDGDIASPDFLWEGAQYSSRTYYYQNRASGQERIERVIKQYVPFGTPIQIEYTPNLISQVATV